MLQFSGKTETDRGPAAHLCSSLAVPQEVNATLASTFHTAFFTT